MTRKLYCYVDESGLDTAGKLFIVTVVITAEQKEQLIELCQSIEESSGKGRVKWSKISYPKRLAYMERMIKQPSLKGVLNFNVYYNTKNYTTLTIETVALAVKVTGVEDYRATVLIDGLPKSLEQQISRNLHHLGVRTKKVRGVKNDENDALVRLADAVCGFVREAMEKNEEMLTLFKEGIKEGILVDLSKK